ncbi:MAG TPA: hypothetical protein VM433_14425 [Mycobacteriales bacterium]|nr:hypothetical protein [Mycobacteriales bacterium]
MGERTGARLLAVAALAFLLFNYPLLAIVDKPVTVFGLPLLWTYLLTAWALVIGLVAWITRDP